MKLDSKTAMSLLFDDAAPSDASALQWGRVSDAAMRSQIAKKHATAIVAHALELMPGAEQMARARAAPLDPDGLERAIASMQDAVHEDRRHALAVFQSTVAVDALGLDPSEYVTDARFLAPAFTPGPPVPAPPPQDWPHANIVRRSIAGDDDDAVPRLPSLRGFLAAAAASDDWGVPVRSTSDPERFGKGALRGGGGRPHDPHVGREHYALAQRELARVALGLSAIYGLDALEQMAVWCTVAGAGRIELRNIHVGGSTDAIDREERRAAKQTKRRKRGTMQPPAKRRAFLVPERKTLTATQVALELRRFDVHVTPHQVGLVCRRVTERVRAAFEAKGWIRAQTKSEQAKPEAAKGARMATLMGHDLQGWKPILEIIGCSANTARALMARKERRLPVTMYLGTPNAKSVDLRAWQNAEVAAALGTDLAETG